MKRTPRTRNIGVKDGFVSHLLVFFCLLLGFLFGSNTLSDVFPSNASFFLEDTQISSPISPIAENHFGEKAALEKEEKEEKETESVSEGNNAWYGTEVGDLFPHTLGTILIPGSNLFEPYSRRKLFILFHCLKSHLA